MALPFLSLNGAVETLSNQVYLRLSQAATAVSLPFDCLTLFDSDLLVSTGVSAWVVRHS